MKLINQIIHFIYDECSGNEANKALIIKYIKDMLDRTTLRSRNEEELWDLVWDKPLYSGRNTRASASIVNFHREKKTFSDYKSIPDSIERVSGFRLTAIRLLAKKFPLIFDHYSKILNEISTFQATNADSNFNNSENLHRIRNLLGVTPHFQKSGSIFTDSQVSHAKSVTILHMLTDFGFPVCKPDIWVLRISEAISKLNGGEYLSLESFIQESYPDFKLTYCSQDGFLLHNFHYVFLIIDYLINFHFDSSDSFFNEHGLDLNSQFRKHRFIDLIVAKFGMTLEEGFGMIHSPFDLLEKNEVLKSKYTDLSSIVALVNSDLSKPIIKGEKKIIKTIAKITPKKLSRSDAENRYESFVSRKENISKYPDAIAGRRYKEIIVDEIMLINKDLPEQKKSRLIEEIFMKYNVKK